MKSDKAEVLKNIKSGDGLGLGMCKWWFWFGSGMLRWVTNCSSIYRLLAVVDSIMVVDWVLRWWWRCVTVVVVPVVAA